MENIDKYKRMKDFMYKRTVCSKCGSIYLNEKPHIERLSQGTPPSKDLKYTIMRGEIDSILNNYPLSDYVKEKYETIFEEIYKIAQENNLK